MISPVLDVHPARRDETHQIRAQTIALGRWMRSALPAVGRGELETLAIPPHPLAQMRLHWTAAENPHPSRVQSCPQMDAPPSSSYLQRKDPPPSLPPPANRAPEKGLSPFKKLLRPY